MVCELPRLQKQQPKVIHVGRLLVEGLGVRGGGRDVGVTGSLVRASGELELVGGLQVGIAGLAVGAGVVLEVEKDLEHYVCKRHKIINTNSKNSDSTPAKAGTKRKNRGNVLAPDGESVDTQNAWKGAKDKVTSRHDNSAPGNANAEGEPARARVDVKQACSRPRGHGHRRQTFTRACCEDNAPSESGESSPGFDLWTHRPDPKKLKGLKLSSFLWRFCFLSPGHKS